MSCYGLPNSVGGRGRGAVGIGVCTRGLPAGAGPLGISEGSVTHVRKGTIHHPRDQCIIPAAPWV